MNIIRKNYLLFLVLIFILLNKFVFHKQAKYIHQWFSTSMLIRIYFLCTRPPLIFDFYCNKYTTSDINYYIPNLSILDPRNINLRHHFYADLSTPILPLSVGGTRHIQLHSLTVISTLLKQKSNAIKCIKEQCNEVM